MTADSKPDSFESPESSNIVGGAYSYTSHEMIVNFKNGGGYKYTDIPASLWEQFSQSESKGSFFHNYIRSKYEGKKL